MLLFLIGFLPNLITDASRLNWVYTFWGAEQFLKLPLNPNRTNFLNLTFMKTVAGVKSLIIYVSSPVFLFFFLEAIFQLLLRDCSRCDMWVFFLCKPFVCFLGNFNLVLFFFHRRFLTYQPKLNWIEYNCKGTTNLFFSCLQLTILIPNPLSSLFFFVELRETALKIKFYLGFVSSKNG